MNVEVLFDGMTWADLRAFVALSDEPDDANVGIAYDMQAEPYGVWVQIDPSRVSKA